MEVVLLDRRGEGIGIESPAISCIAESMNSWMVESAIGHREIPGAGMVESTIRTGFVLNGMEGLTLRECSHAQRLLGRIGNGASAM